jgi:hypothetical protein
MAALKEYRSKGEQKMTVQDVHVAKGGQAIVGNVNAPAEGVGRAKKSEVQPHAVGYAPGVEMPRQIEAERATVPSPGGSGVYVPIVFNFDKPETKDFTETVRLLAGLAKFVIADIINPRSAPLELQATVPESLRQDRRTCQRAFGKTVVQATLTKSPA